MKSIHLKTEEDQPNGTSPIYTKTTFLIIFVFVMQNIAVTVSLHTSEYPGNETDHSALLAIKSQLVDNPGSILNSWNNSVHHCNWEGVICGSKHNRVTQLDLSSRGLSGTISPFIGNLSFLKYITLPNNFLYGQIPKTLGLLNRLYGLWLFNNTLTGEIPANISGCINLKFISLGHNNLEGHLPVGLKALSKLEQLTVDNNYFNGTLFDMIHNHTSFTLISARFNSFTGTIPNSIGRMRNLTTLLVTQNELSGTLPTSLFNLSSLQYLELSFNKLHGEVSADTGFTLPRLTRLNLAGNNFSGPLPISILNHTSLESIQLYTNSFTGRIPQNFGNFPNLTTLNLMGNNLVGGINFITTLVNCTHLKILALDGNNFSGILPDSVANLSNTLTWLSMGNNLIRGTLPTGITNLINLFHLKITNSAITATLPRDFGKLQKLECIDLSSNRLTGRIPYSVGNLSRLSTFSLKDNQFDGSIPKSIGNCQNLLNLDLSNNHFSGNIPSKLFGGGANFIKIRLSQNHLQGPLPAEISKQINLIDFKVSNNMLSGVIPDDLSGCRDLQYLDMSGNFFHGNIPHSLTSLSSIVAIGVSHNQLSGEIPAFLSKLPLIYLNISYNDFEGSVPTIGVFGNASVVFPVGNNKLCGGIPALHLPKCVEIKTREKTSFFYTLTKVEIITVFTLVGMFAISLGLFLIRRNAKQPIFPTSTTTETFTKVSYAMLLKATSGFSSDNLLGAGSFGSVFKGILSGKTIAVKVLNLEHRGASKSFISECKALRNVRHRNLVSIITACSSIDFQRNDFKALVYDFMPNGSLDQWLLGVFGNMSLVQRVDVAIHVAYALNYLHHECEIPIVHCDLKPSNILLDHDMLAHVGDFGLSKFISQPQHLNQSSTTGIRGTIGYAAPEYGLGSKPSTDGDVYSYGILLLELMTGKSPTDSMFKENYNLHKYAEEALPEQVLQIVDPTLDEDNQTEEAVNDRRVIQDMLQRRVECIVTVISIGVSCSNHSPNNRMRITDAISKLQAARNNLFNARKCRKRPARGV